MQSRVGGWQFEPSGRFASSLVDGHSLLLSVQYPELQSQGSLLTLRMKVYSCLTESSACLAPSSLRFQVTLLPASDGENFSEIDLGNMFSHYKMSAAENTLFPEKHAKHVCLFQVLEVERLPDHL